MSHGAAMVAEAAAHKNVTSYFFHCFNVLNIFGNTCHVLLFDRNVCHCYGSSFQQPRYCSYLTDCMQLVQLHASVVQYAVKEATEPSGSEQGRQCESWSSEYWAQQEVDNRYWSLIIDPCFPVCWTMALEWTRQFSFYSVLWDEYSDSRWWSSVNIIMIFTAVPQLHCKLS